MSLFPAYEIATEEILEKGDDTTKEGTAGTWLENSSYTLPKILPQATEIPVPIKAKVDIEVPVFDFNGSEEYYVDKHLATQYRTIDTLHAPARPKYRSRYPPLGRSNIRKNFKRFRRYFKLSLPEETKTSNLLVDSLDENSFTQMTTSLNRNIVQNPTEVMHWVDLVRLQDKNPHKWSKKFVTEKKLEILQKALFHHFGNDALYKLYLDVISSSYPSFEASNMIKKLISKDPYNYILWTGQIITTQCNMARCIVPDVLKIYEHCMQKMHTKRQNDEIMLRLFNNCALFLRQAGLNEQFFALIKLGLELNVSSDKFTRIQPLDKDQQTLIEYEELVLQSRLPMNEIWLRIEKLRQSFNFLPCPPNMKCTDPQRIVFNEDICHYIYPLVTKHNAFYLILIILRLIKVPFITNISLRNRFHTEVENVGDTDAIEDIFGVVLSKYKCPEDKFHNFYTVLYEISKEMVVCPTFLNSTVGYEIYSNMIYDFLVTCADCFEERKQQIFIILWLRVERIQVILHKVANKLDAAYKKKLRSKVKSLFKKEQNRNTINFYIEYALLEYEMGEMETCDGIFKQITSSNDSSTINSDSSNAFLSYAYVLIKENNLEKALRVLMCYSLGLSVKDLDASDLFTDAKKLSAFKKLSERLASIQAIEQNVTIMELEQYFLPDFYLNLLQMRALYQYILGNQLDAISNLETSLRHFNDNNERHNYLREQINEVLVLIMHYDSPQCIVSNSLILNKVSAALCDYPSNLFFLQSCAMLHSLPWYKIRSMLLKNTSIFSVIFIIILARLRYVRLESEGENNEHNENTYRNRVVNVLKTLNEVKAFQRNALFWRFYLRFLSNTKTPFETSQSYLLSALDECPWNKSLYMDGAIFAPQELSHLQDLMIEKNLRMYALPQELEILQFDAPTQPSNVV